MHAAQGSIKGFTQQLSNVGNIVTGLASIPGAIKTLVEPLTKPITLASDVEVLGKSFKTLLGSGEAAAQMLKDVVGFSGSTPFQITEVAPAAKQLLAFGFAANKVLPLMQDIGDMSALMDKPINEVADAFGRLKSGQFGEAFERMRAFGLSMKDLQGAGLVFDKSGSFVGSADQAIEAVRQIIRRKFGGGMKEISSTFKGQFSNLTDAWEQMETKFGAPITKALTPIISELTAHINEWQPIAESFGKTLATGISDAFALFKSGELGKTLQTALIGLDKVIFSSLSTSVSAAMEIGSTVLKAGFQSAIALLTDGNFWAGMKNSVISIVETARAMLLETAADIRESLPKVLGGGKDQNEEWQRKSLEASRDKLMQDRAADMASGGKDKSYYDAEIARRNREISEVGTRGLASAAKNNAAEADQKAFAAFNLVDFNKVMAPWEKAGPEVVTTVKGAAASLFEKLGKISEFSQVGNALRNASTPAQSQMVSLAEQMRAASSGDMFLSGGSSRYFNQTPDGGSGQMGALLNPQVMEKLLNPNSKTGDSNTGNLKKAIDDAGPLKRLITLLEQVQENTAAQLSAAGVYGL